MFPSIFFASANNGHSIFKNSLHFFSIFFSSCDTLHVSAGYHKRKKMEQGFTLSKALGRRLCCTHKRYDAIGMALAHIMVET